MSLQFRMKFDRRFEDDYARYRFATSSSNRVDLSKKLVVSVISETEAMDYERTFLANLSLVVLPMQKFLMWK